MLRFRRNRIPRRMIWLAWDYSADHTLSWSEIIEKRINR